MKPTTAAKAFLHEIDRGDLAILLEYATYEISMATDAWDLPSVSIMIFAPPLFTEALTGLGPTDKKRIAESLVNTDLDADGLSTSPEVLQFCNCEALQVDSTHELLAEIICQRNTMADVATGGSRIADVNDYYKARRRRIQAALQRIGIDDPNPFSELWEWYHKWKAEFGTYSERCRFLTDLFQPIISQLSVTPIIPSPARELTGWDRVDRTVTKARQQLAFCQHEEDYQSVGLLCREALISVAQAVYDPDAHGSLVDITPSDTDAKRMIEAFIGATLPGSSNETVRAYAKASLKLANELVHKRTATFQYAALCLEVTSSVVNTLAIIAGKRDECMATVAGMSS